MRAERPEPLTGRPQRTDVATGRSLRQSRPLQRDLASKAPTRLGEVTAIPDDAKHRAMEEYRRLGLRGQLMDGVVFTDPAWNMLLDLFISEARGNALSVSAVCIGSRSSSSTALRYLAMLGAQGLAERSVDSRDQRRSHVRLSRRGLEAMLQIFVGETAPGVPGVDDGKPR